MPGPVPWRDDATPDMVVLAVGKCLGAVMDASRWTELGLLTGTRDRLTGHPRLLRSLPFGDDDRQGCVYDVHRWLLGEALRHNPVTCWSWPCLGCCPHANRMVPTPGRPSAS